MNPLLKRLHVALVLAVVLFPAITGVQFVRLAEANFWPLPGAVAIYIRSDGSVDPPTAPIKRVGDVYTFTGSMLFVNQKNAIHFHFIEIQRDNIVVDGAGYILESYGSNGYSGIKLKDRSNVTIKNVEIRYFDWGITLLNSSNNTITRNNVNNNAYGIQILSSSNNNIVIENNLENNYYLGIQISSSNNNAISKNIIALTKNFSWMHAINLYNSSSNGITGNMITNHINGIDFGLSSNNIIYHNNFVNNQKQVSDSYMEQPSVNIWDNGKEGNYWSNYNGTDSNGDGIGDTPYVVYANNTDRFPLMNPVNVSPVVLPLPSDRLIDHSPPTVSIVSPENKTYSVNNVSLTFTVSEPTSWVGYSLDGQANVTIAGNTTLTGLSDGTHSLMVYARAYGWIISSPMIHFVVDTTLPNISILSPENKIYTTTNIPLNFTVNETVTWIGYSVNGQANVTITGNTTLSGLSYGSHNLTVYAKDTAGNTGASETINFTLAHQSEFLGTGLPMEYGYTAVAVIVMAMVAAIGFLFLKRLRRRKQGITTAGEEGLRE